MSIDRAQFISQFLYQINEEEPYWAAGLPPSEEIIQHATSLATEDLSFVSQVSDFEMLAQTIDICVAQELACHGTGMAATNASKHPRVVALTKLAGQRRAGIAVASAQSLAWMEQCRQWVQDHSLRNQIAKRVITGILVKVGRTKGYSNSEIAALVRIGATLRDMDLFVIRARGAIIEILAANVAQIADDKETRTILKRFIGFSAGYPANLQPVLKGIAKLNSVIAGG